MNKIAFTCLLLFTETTITPVNTDKAKYSLEFASLALVGAGALLHVCMPSSLKASLIIKEQEYDLRLSHVLFGIGWLLFCLGTVNKMGNRPSSYTDDNPQARGLYGWLTAKFTH